MYWWGFLLLGLGVGAISGVLGIGGGVLLVPALVFLFDFSQQQAQGTSLAALVPPVGLFAAMQYYRQGYVDPKAALWVALGFAVGAFATAGFVKDISENVLRQLFGVLLLFLGVRLIIATDRRAHVFLAGLIACGGAWTAFLLLKSLGVRYGIRPSLMGSLRKMGALSPADGDYQI